ncbi:MAG TPA: 5-(carboxyamino)imidazole ribonucleotide synthase [Acidimicrobiia bacterium]|nr:5-(carboxyamino)imidazole ribonucleotide synthase [Acidimicrobiia bacterium]
MSEPIVAVLGGGQLGRMLGLAGIASGLRFRFLDPGVEAPAGAVGALVTGALDSTPALDEVAQGADVVTYEWEGVPADSARHLARTHRLAPGVRALEVSQDRASEKALFQSLGIATATVANVDTRAELDAAVEKVGLPSILKTRRGGYDGKGQCMLRAAADVERAWTELGGVPLILESLVDFRRELSIVAARATDGTTVCWPVVENVHRDGVLHITRAPAPGWSPRLQAAAAGIGTAVLDALDFVGVGCVELFETTDALVANELAPRVHNSGHWTIEGAQTSQFENHLRAILDRPLGSTAPRGASAMVNCLGSMPDTATVLAIEGAHLHDYGKQARPGRKVGHVTITAADEAALAPRLEALLRVIDG